jgi:hypothetical protein
VIFKRLNNTFRASTKLVEREQGEAREIERKKGPKFNDTVGHPSLKFEVTLFSTGVSQLLFRDNTPSKHLFSWPREQENPADEVRVEANFAADERSWKIPKYSQHVSMFIPNEGEASPHEHRGG